MPERGPATVAAIAAIIGILLFLVLIGTVVVLVRKQLRKKADGPPTYKPPPPVKSSMTADRNLQSGINQDFTPEHPLVYYETQNKTEPITDLDSYHGEENVDDPRTFDYSAPCGWELEEPLPPYSDHLELGRELTGSAHGNMATSVTRGESFVSSAVIV
ncbi:hypothetical protein P4O66_010547 [Electrophorus voltai]|uniref:Uncharacterized protein n=1 Tax=Electrophorus voltai TaxID=2609070 RepID=A0AAD8Z9X7_9TELE|nr:hypothetical protein P4O66_010547 [Electrophorus voltai]